MTPQQARDLVPILTAYAEGKVVQWRHARPGSNWDDYTTGLGHPALVGDPREEWRIKPTPREWWLVLGTAGMVMEATPDPIRAQRVATESDHRRVVHVREVLT